MSFVNNLKESSSTVNEFVNSRIGEFFAILLPLIPFFIIWEIPMEILSKAGIPGLLAMRFIWFYAWCVLIVSWIRVCMGSDRKTGIFRFDKDLLVFTVMLIVILFTINFIPKIANHAIGLDHLSMGVGLFSVLLNRFFAISLYLLGVFALVRLSFMLCGQAEGTKISPMESAVLTRNIEAEIIYTGLLSALPYLVVGAVFIFLLPFAGQYIVLSENELANAITWKILGAPFSLVIKPLVVVIGVTSLVHFYVRQTQGAEETA